MSSESSPSWSAEEKAGVEKETDVGEGLREDVEEAHEAEEVTQQISSYRSREGERPKLLHPPLHQTRSHSSVRSGRSYTDGYTHFDHGDDEEKQQSGPNTQPEEGKEFEVSFDGDLDPFNPKNKSTLRKWSIVLIGSACSLCVTCASALYTSTYQQMEKDFEISRILATVGLTTYVCGLGLGPMFLAPLSEFYGRRIIYISAFGMFFIWMVRNRRVGTLNMSERVH